MYGGEELAKVLIYYGLIDTPTNNQKIICPFHGDVNPSMMIDLNEGKYFCFGCYTSGDALKFVIDIEKQNGLNDLQACIKFNKIINDKGLSKVKLKRNMKTTVEDLEEKQEMLNVAKDYYFGLKTIDWENDVDLFSEVNDVGEYMVKRGFTRSVLTKIKAKVTFNKSYPIIFPMYDNGEFKGWVCRTNIKSIEEKRKYLYNKGFRRAETLVGHYDNKKPVIIVEGFMDMLKFRMFGYKNVVAILGWKMSDIQINKLKNAGCKHIISALDNDKCGIKGTKYASQFFKVTRWCYLKGIKDPGEMKKSEWQRMFNKTKLKYMEDKRK